MFDTRDLAVQRQQQQHQQLQQLSFKAHEWDADFARRSGGFHQNRVGTGNATNSAFALHTARHICVVCSRDGCSALVDLKTANQQAKAAGRDQHEPGDGCAASWTEPPCSSNANRSRFAKKQRHYIEQLESDERVLVNWPASRVDRSAPLVQSDLQLRAAIDAARAQLDGTSSTRG